MVRNWWNRRGSRQPAPSPPLPADPPAASEARAEKLRVEELEERITIGILSMQQ